MAIFKKFFANKNNLFKGLEPVLACFFCAAFFLSCENFLNSDAEVRALLEQEVAYNTAEEIPVLVMTRTSSAGTVLNPPDKVKLGFPFYVKFQINDSYGTFSEWKVYAGGIGEEHLLPAEDYAVGNEESSDKLYTAGITIKKKHDNIRIVPEVAEHPGIQFEHPSVETEAGAKKETGTITPRGSSKQIVGKAFEVSVKMNEDYAFYDWEIFQRSAGGNVTLTPAERTNEDGEKILEFSDSEGEVIFTAENLDEKKYLDEAACSMTIKKDLKDRKFIITAKTVERPKLKMCSPGNGASEINRAASIILNFTKPIKKESFTLNDITVKAENANNIPLDYVTAVYGFNEPFFSNNDATVRIPGKGDENHLLPQDGLIYVTLSGFISSVEDGKDIPLGKDYSFYFSTGKITDGDFDNSGFSAEFYQKVNSADFVIASSTSAQYETISKNRVTLKKNFSGMINISNAQRSDENESTMFKFKLSGGDKSGVSQIILRERYFITDGGTQLFSESGEWKNVPGYSQSDCEKEYAYVLTDLPTSFGTGNDTYGFDFTLGGKDDGVHQFSVICRDKYMNESTPQTVYVVKDTTPPKASDFKDFFELQNTENDNPNKTQYKTIGGKHYYRNINPMITLKLKEQMNDCGNELPQENLHLGSDDGNLKFKIGYSTSNTTAPTAESDVWNTLASNTTGTSQTVTLPKYDADVSGYRKFDLPYYIWLWVEDDFGNHDTALIDYSPMLDTTGPDVSDVKVYPLKTSGTNVWAKWSDKPKNGNMSEYDHTEIWYGGQKQNGTKEETDQQGWAKGVTQKSSENIEIRFYDKDGNYSKIVKQRPMTYHDGAYSLETECNLTTKTTITGKRQKDNVTDKVDRTVEIFGVEAGPMYFAWPDNDSNASHNKSASVTLGTFGTCTDDDLIEGTGNIAKMDGSWITIETKIEGGSYLTTTPSTEKTTGGVKNNSNPTVQIGDFYIQNYVMAKGFIQALIKWGTGKSKDKYTNINSSDISGEYWTRGGGNFTFYSAMCYCNILSEMCGLEPVYYTNSACTAVFRNGNDRTYYEDKTKNGYRIPTKYEWEWAATSCGNKTVTEGYNYCGFIPIGTPPKTAIYYWNRRFDDRVDYVWDNERQTYIDYGLMGMSGNMWEWTSSKNADGTYIMKGGAYTSEKDKLTYYWDGSSDYATNKNNSWGLRMVRNAEW